MRSVLLLLTALFTPAAALAVPTTLTHQGRLLQHGDQPVSGVLPVRFSLYAGENTAAPLWSVDRQVEFAGGQYAVTLGEASDPALDATTFEKPVWLGVTVNGVELTPRMRVSSVPYALRAAFAESMDGGTIANATITNALIDGANIENGSISNAIVDAIEVRVGGAPVLDSYGRYVGPTDQLNASRLGGLEAAKFPTFDDGDLRWVRKTGDAMDGPLTSRSIITGEQIRSTTTTDPPFVVQSNQMVPGLHAERVGGLSAQDIYTFASRENETGDNLVLDGSFESPALGWALKSYGPQVSVTLQRRSEPRHGRHALSIVDTDTSSTNGPDGVEQQVLDAVEALANAGRTFTASVWARRQEGTGSGRLCLVEGGEPGTERASQKTCAALPTGPQYARAHVTHTLSAQPERLSVVIETGATDQETATWLVDALAVHRGSQPQAFVPHASERAMPAGTIVMWSGRVEDIPTGWALCDGTKGTPNLLDRFVMSIPSSNATPGTYGGSHEVTLTTQHLPAHTHAATSASAGTHNHVATSADAGAHNHSGTTSTNGEHTHTTRTVNHDNNSSSSQGYPAGDIHRSFRTTDRVPNRDLLAGAVLAAGDHHHSFTTSTNGSHSHAITVDQSGSHTHAITVQSSGEGRPVDVRPAYFTVAFLMKL